MKTYKTLAVGNFGPAHPLHDPCVRVYVDGKLVYTGQNGRDAHLWAIREGLVPENKSLLDSPNYQAMMAEVRYQQAGL